MPHSSRPEQKEFNKDSPDNLPSLPTTILSTPVSLHFLAIACAINFIDASFICSGYVPLISYSLNIDGSMFIFFSFVIGSSLT